MLASRLSRAPLARQPLTVAVDVSVSGDNTIVGASALHRMRVLSYMLVAAGTVLAQWKSGDRTLTGPMPMIANSNLNTGQPTLDVWLFQTDVGQPLLLNLNAAVRVTGHVTYSLETD